MKQLATALVFMAALFLAACGMNSNNNNNSSINGNWNASLTPAQNGSAPTLAFTTTLNSNSNNSVTGTNLSFTTNNGCFSNGASETGSFNVSGDFSGNASGGFGLTVQGPATGATGNNTLTLQGTLVNNTITGTWSLTGLQSGCSGSGNFTMTRM